MASYKDQMQNSLKWALFIPFIVISCSPTQLLTFPRWWQLWKFYDLIVAWLELKL